MLIIAAKSALNHIVAATARSHPGLINNNAIAHLGKFQHGSSTKRNQELFKI
ncbi:hypothetical protein OGM63_27675 [Plectonema radiosum NIES-515]|uniref:Transposase n=1 Tax=Plectonema radiosum NIES-515 TaxID=2986073 RepID=A0ABT3B8F6_9CYAN|nr:hypothetical protein [Plectonema radiosum]MCV3217245.1 hypothetical protein [Plectonema radiosum NIES-515]